MDAARARHVSAVAASSAHLEAVRGIGASADATARMIAALGERFAIVAPGSSNATGAGFGWWRVDQATGGAVGVMASGFNQDTVEVNVNDVITEQYLKDLNPRWTKDVFCGTSLGNLLSDLFPSMGGSAYWDAWTGLFKIKSAICGKLIF